MEEEELLKWEMAIEIYMFHLNMTREEACVALGIKCIRDNFTDDPDYKILKSKVS